MFRQPVQPVHTASEFLLPVALCGTFAVYRLDCEPGSDAAGNGGLPRTSCDKELGKRPSALPLGHIYTDLWLSVYCGSFLLLLTDN